MFWFQHGLRKDQNDREGDEEDGDDSRNYIANASFGHDYTVLWADISFLCSFFRDYIGYVFSFGRFIQGWIKLTRMSLNMY